MWSNHLKSVLDILFFAVLNYTPTLLFLSKSHNSYCFFFPIIFSGLKVCSVLYLYDSVRQFLRLPESIPLFAAVMCSSWYRCQTEVILSFITFIYCIKYPSDSYLLKELVSLVSDVIFELLSFVIYFLKNFNVWLVLFEVS